MEPIRPVSAPSAGGSKNALAACVATKYLRMRCASAACSPGVATSSRLRMEPTGWEFYSKQELPGILTVCSYLTSGYQLSNDHPFPFCVEAGLSFSVYGRLYSGRVSGIEATLLM